MKANQKGFSVVEMLIVIVVVGLLGAVGWLIYDRQKSKADNKDIAALTSQQEQKQETPKETETKLDYDKIYNEVALKFGLKKDDLRRFWIYSEDKVIYAKKDQGPGSVYLYKPTNTWQVASEAIQYQAICSEIDKLPEAYRPPCNDTEGLAVAKKGDLTFKYVADQTVWTSDEQLEKSTNYPAGNRYKYVSVEAVFQ